MEERKFPPPLPPLQLEDPPAPVQHYQNSVIRLSEERMRQLAEHFSP